MKGYSEDRQFYYKRLVEKYLDPKEIIMYPFNKKVTTNKKSQGTNECTGIVIHHTAG